MIKITADKGIVAIDAHGSHTEREMVQYGLAMIDAHGDGDQQRTGRD